MNNLDEILNKLRKEAAADPAFLQKLLSSREDPSPLRKFCADARDRGYPLYEMDLLNAGEEYYANMRRSTNGGGENSPMLTGEDDYYELFMMELERLAEGQEK